MLVPTLPPPSGFPGAGAGSEVGPAATHRQPTLQQARPVWALLYPCAHTAGPPASPTAPPAPATPGRCLVSPGNPLGCPVTGFLLCHHHLCPSRAVTGQNQGLHAGWGTQGAAPHSQDPPLVLQEDTDPVDTPWRSSPAFRRTFDPEPHSYVPRLVRFCPLTVQPGLGHLSLSTGTDGLSVPRSCGEEQQLRSRLQQLEPAARSPVCLSRPAQMVLSAARSRARRPRNSTGAPGGHRELPAGDLGGPAVPGEPEQPVWGTLWCKEPSRCWYVYPKTSPRGLFLLRALPVSAGTPVPHPGPVDRPWDTSPSSLA